MLVRISTVLGVAHSGGQFQVCCSGLLANGIFRAVIYFCQHTFAALCGNGYRLRGLGQVGSFNGQG